jgi:hypothetical protein
MDLSRKIGVGVTMIVPGFVMGGLAWDLMGSFTPILGWLAVLGVEIVMLIIYALVITGKFIPGGQQT